jgi:putative aldouronate transport system permease protein
MLVPTLAFFIINNYIPMIGIYYAFTKFNIKGGLFGSPFIGLDNFKFLYKSNVLFNITKNTIMYNFIFIILGNGFQIFAAILLSKLIGNKFRKITQTLMFQSVDKHKM